MNDFDRVAKVIDYVDQNRRNHPSLGELAALVSLSPPHFQRLFQRWAGISPKKFLQLLTVDAVKQRLLDGQSVLEAALDEGLSGPGRLHDLTVLLESATPGELKSGGRDWTIQAGFSSSPFGDCLIVNTPRGISRIEFVEERRRTNAQEDLQKQWHNALVSWDDQVAESIARRIFRLSKHSSGQPPLKCFVHGTPFQIQVWRALLRIPPGQLATYDQIASAIGKPTASRAVGNAIGRNPIGYLIPCHRVIRKTGVIGNYRWGHVRKKVLISRELSAASSSACQDMS